MDAYHTDLMRTILMLALAVIAVAVGAGALAAFGGLDDAKEIPMQPTNKTVSRSGYDIARLTPAQIEFLAKKLTPEQYRVTQKSGTEAAFCGNLVDNHKDGIYTCVVCGLPLFRSSDKFNSGTGWPSFFQPFDRDHIAYIKDGSHGMERIEIQCARCTSQQHAACLLERLDLRLRRTHGNEHALTGHRDRRAESGAVHAGRRLQTHRRLQWRECVEHPHCTAASGGGGCNHQDMSTDRDGAAEAIAAAFG